MLSIHIPESFATEIQYTFSILLEEFLGQHCTYALHREADFKISFTGGKPVYIKNEFFRHYKESKGYIHKKSLPRTSSNWSDPDLNILDLPVLYGKAGLKETEDAFYIQVDVIASAFFLLSRWEEVIDDHRDEHKRSQGIHSVAFKHRFLKRPVVNEYTDLLWTILMKAGYKGTRKKHNYSFVITHDIDQAYQWPDWYTGMKHLGGDMLKRRDFTLAKRNLTSFYRTMTSGAEDPFDHHQYLLDLAEKNGYQAHFNFIVSRKSKYDQALAVDDPRLKALIDKIESAGHIIGYHPGYNVYANQQRFNAELAILQGLVKQDIISGRQHYLRFKIADTWQLWDRAGMQWDSSMGYSDIPGFRCGTCYTYTVFDCIARKKLNVKEKPLILMDATLVYYQKAWNPDELYALKNECKKHGGEWVSIWHNDLVKNELLKDFESLILN
jgi:hypothetical protein